MRKGIAVAVFVVMVVAAVVGWRGFTAGPMAFAGGPTVALGDYRGHDPSGVPAALASANLVKRGEYLARAADCMVCHTAPGGVRYAGSLAIPLPFGTIYSPNITPDKGTGIGDYSDRDFLNAVQRGIRRDGSRLYPAMPYTSYTYMTDADALAIKAYLFSLPPVHAVDRGDTFTFPFNQRWTMAFWSLIFNADTRFTPNIAQSADWNRGAYLAEALAHCGECHTPRNFAFALDNGKKFAGAETAGWQAFNITPDKASGIGNWTDDQIFTYLAKGHTADHGTAAGPMGEVVDQSFSRMEASDIHALVSYLRSVPATASSAPATIAPPAPASPREGRATANIAGTKVFEEACASCHSWTGVSAISPFATIAGTRAVNDPSAINIAQIVISGTTRYSPRGIISMPAFGASYSDVEIAAVANYVTARFGGSPSTLMYKDIARLRRETVR